MVFLYVMKNIFQVNTSNPCSLKPHKIKDSVFMKINYRLKQSIIFHINAQMDVWLILDTSLGWNTCNFFSTYSSVVIIAKYI